MVIRKFYNLQALDAAATRLPRRHRVRGMVMLRYLVDQAYFASGWSRTPRGDRWKIERGDLVTSRSILAAAIGWTGRGVQSMLNVLVRADLVTVHSTRRGTLVTVVYYNAYHEKKSDQQTSAAESPRVRTLPAAPEKVINRHSTPPQTPPNMNIIIKNKNLYHSLNSKPKNNTILPVSKRERLFKIMQKIDFRTAQGRSKGLDKLRDLLPWVHRERIQARAYLIQAARGRVPAALGYKFFTTPEFTPADFHLADAKAEEFPPGPCGDLHDRQQNRELTIAKRRDQMLRDLAISTTAA